MSSKTKKKRLNWEPGRGLSSRKWDRPAVARKPSRSRLAEIEMEMYGMIYQEEKDYYRKIGVPMPSPKLPSQMEGGK